MDEGRSNPRLFSPYLTPTHPRIRCSAKLNPRYPSPMNPLTRRDFAKRLAVAGAGAALSTWRVRGANDRVRLGFIGLGNRGDQVLDAFLKHPDAEIAAICDLNEAYLDAAASILPSGESLPMRSQRSLKTRSAPSASIAIAPVRDESTS